MGVGRRNSQRDGSKARARPLSLALPLLSSRSSSSASTIDRNNPWRAVLNCSGSFCTRRAGQAAGRENRQAAWIRRISSTFSPRGYPGSAEFKVSPKRSLYSKRRTASPRVRAFHGASRTRSDDLLAGI